MPTKTKQSESQRIPKLRFSGFFGGPSFAKAMAGNWEEKRLGEVGHIVTGTTPPTAEKNYYGGDIPWVTPTDINNNKNIYISAKQLTKKGVEKGRFIPKDSLLVTCIASIGKNTILRVDGSCNQQINAILPNDKNNVDFLYYLLEKDKNILIKFAGAGGMQMLNKKGFSGLKFLMPPLPEQQKIADFLGLVDRRIENLCAQKENFEFYKKGMMQKIFAQEIRFKDNKGNNFPEWEEKKLGEIGSFKTSSVDKKTNENQKSVKLLNYMDVYRRDHIFADDTFQEITAKDNQIISSDLKRGDVLFTPSSETPVDIGHSAVVMEDLPDTVFSYHLMRLRPKKDVILPDFSAYAFKSFVFYKKFCRLAQGATRFTLSIEAFKGASVVIPKSLREQQKIAEFLTSIDNLIKSKQQQITQAEQWKKGLMQGLFV